MDEQLTKDTGKKVLLVDDDRLLQGMYARKFTECGHTVETAETAAEALEKLRAGTNPDLIVFDIVMPGMDGFDFLGALAQEKLGERAVKVALSNQTNEEDMERAKTLGVDAFVVKATAIPSEIVTQVLSVSKNKSV